MNVWFRVDSSAQIGTGHLVRCLTLATGLRERGAHATFVSRAHEGNLIDRVRGSGFDVVVLPQGFPDAPDEAQDRESLRHASWLGSTWQSDARLTRDAIGDASVDWLVVDHYAIDDRWERELRSAVTRIMVIDDLADRPHDCDLLLDQNLVADFERRYDALVPARCGRLLGPRFALLQPLYADLHDRTPPRSGAPTRVLVFFGGADSDNLTGRAVEAFLGLQRDDVALDVVAGCNQPHLANIHGMVAGRDNIVVHCDLPSLAKLIAKADLAIGAGGATSWERCCLGLPALVITLASNQEPIAAELDRVGLVRWLGSKDEVDQHTIAQALCHLLADGLSPEWSERCRALVDGHGLERVCGYLTLSSTTALVPRPASSADESLLLEWANDATTRRNAFSTAQIDPVTHHNWFSARLSDAQNCRFYIVETDGGLPIGQVRFQQADGDWELHYSMDQRARGRKLGKALLASATHALRADLVKSFRLIARVRTDNAVSSAVLRSLGFRIAREADQIVEYAQDA